MNQEQRCVELFGCDILDFPPQALEIVGANYDRHSLIGLPDNLGAPAIVIIEINARNGMIGRRPVPRIADCYDRTVRSGFLEQQPVQIRNG